MPWTSKAVFRAKGGSARYEYSVPNNMLDKCISIYVFILKNVKSNLKKSASTMPQPKCLCSLMNGACIQGEGNVSWLTWGWRGAKPEKLSAGTTEDITCLDQPSITFNSVLITNIIVSL